MTILVVGSGGREHGLAWSANRANRAKIVAAPGNAGMAAIARCVPVRMNDVEGLVQLARTERPDLVLIGPEVPLTLGLADRLAAEKIPAFGPSAAAARLEGSKTFAKEFMTRHNIPTAAYRTCASRAEALAALAEFGLPVVIKADGLAAGKGVTVAMTLPEAQAAIDRVFIEKAFGEAGERLIIEEYMVGEEASLLAFTDGRTVVPMLAAQDHKRIFDHDQGPNTGGMGAYAPAPVITPALAERIQREVLEPVVLGMAEEGNPYRGVLYAGLMMTPDGPRVVEFNCRFGDPEAQVILPLLDSDLVTIAQACIRGQLSPGLVSWKSGAAVCVVMAAPGYPGPYPQGEPITGLEAAESEAGVMVWHAGTAVMDGRLVTQGGRVLNVIATEASIANAVHNVYQAVAKISFSGAQYRRDIAQRALVRTSGV